MNAFGPYLSGLLDDPINLSKSSGSLLLSSTLLQVVEAEVEHTEENVAVVTPPPIMYVVQELPGFLSQFDFERTFSFWRLFSAFWWYFVFPYNLI